MKAIRRFLVVWLTVSTAHTATLETVLIGNVGNAADQSGYGSVSDTFWMGKTEVPNGEYCHFLNAVAANDVNDLFHPQMASTTVGGIIRNGSAGSYTYAVKPAVGDYFYDDKPVVWVTYFDAMRFANWLHNGQPAGSQNAATTEDGAYDLALGGNAVRKSGARAWLPSENEWYKAAYYNPVSATYDLYATGSNQTPDNHPPTTDSGNSANYYNNGWTTGNQSYPLADVGAYSLSASHYGTFDQAGSVWEWTDSLTGSDRIMRGGSWNDNQGSLPSSYRQFYDVTFNNEHVGFRVAAVPEPSTLGLTLLGLLGSILAGWRRR